MSNKMPENELYIRYEAIMDTSGRDMPVNSFPLSLRIRRLLKALSGSDEGEECGVCLSCAAIL